MPVSKVSVLVVDDDAVILRLIERILEKEGYRVVTANNGYPALDIFPKESPDLVLLDVTMATMDGYTTAHRICEFSQVPIIMVTAGSGDKEKLQWFEAGAETILPSHSMPRN